MSILHAFYYNSKSWKDYFPECETLEEYSCMKWELNELSYLSKAECPKHCTTLEYDGKRNFYTKQRDSTRYF